MKRLTALLLLLALLLTACAAGEAQPEDTQDSENTDSTVQTEQTETDTEATWNTITAEDAKARMDSGDPVTVVDVRTASEYADGHIEGALLLPNEDIGTQPPALLPDQDAEILIYCRTGRRSAEAAKKLAAMGYTNISDFGGITDWPYATVTGAFEVPEELREPGVLEGFTSEDLEGNAVDSSIFADYPVNMINVWATFCGPCINEMPDLGELAAEYEPKGVQIIGVVSDVMAADGTYDAEMTQLAKDIVEATGANYLHLMPSMDLIERKLGTIQAVPTTFFVDENGTEIGEPVTGAKSREDWQAILDDLLETYGDSQ